MGSLRVDHVIYAVQDLDIAAARFAAEFGLHAVPGGRHESWGTENRIIPLGRDYLELVRVVDPARAAACDFGRAVLEAAAGGDDLAGWAVATDDLDGVADRLGLDITKGSRATADGSLLSWRLAGIAPALKHRALPFFIAWDGPADLHPGAATAPHHVLPRGITRIEIAEDPDSVGAWLGDHDLPLRVTNGPPALLRIAISTIAGEIVVR
jgi:hypothetical protein